MNDKKLDDTIDLAVREMMDVEPRAGFRHRVLSRIETPERRIFTFGRLATLGAATAVALLVAAISFRTSDTVPRLESPAPAPVRPPIATQPPVDVARPGTVASVNSTSQRREVPRDTVVAETLHEHETTQTLTGVEPLEPPATLTVQRLETPAPTIQDIPLAPLSISELSVEPLDRAQR